jgi:hypothetical protein
MNRFIKYQNGNYTVEIDTKTGTKIRENNLNFFEPEFPESMDIKICDRCDMGCVMCHERSSIDGELGDIMNEKFVETLHPYTELAIGGGNPLEHPSLVLFLRKCKGLNLIPSMTVNQVHFEKYYDFIKALVDDHLIYGLGVSLVDPSDEFIKKVKTIDSAVIHVISGLVSINDLEKLSKNNLKILILGYKVFGRGTNLYANQKEKIDSGIKELKEHLPRILSDGWFNTVSFDNLAVKQLNVKNLMSEEEYKEFFLGEDGFATMYIDMVKKEFARCSTATVRYPLKDDIKSMFEVIHNEITDCFTRKPTA